MTSDRLFVYGTLMRGFDHPMAQAVVAQLPTSSARRRCRGRLYLVKHYPGLVLSDDADDVVFGEVYRLRQPEALLREFDMYEACGEGFAEPTEYIRQMLPVTLERGRGQLRPGPTFTTGRWRSCSGSPRGGSWRSNPRVPDAVRCVRTSWPTSPLLRHESKVREFRDRPL